MEVFFISLPMTQNNQPRNINGRATARADAVDQFVEDEVYACPVEGCGRTFSKKGMKLAEGEGKQRKVRWSDEEKNMLARNMAEIRVAAGQARVFMNQELAKYFPNRNMEMIKGQRKNDDYRAAVDQYVERIIAEQQGGDCPDPAQAADQEHAPGDEATAAPDPWEDYFSNYFWNLWKKAPRFKN